MVWKGEDDVATIDSTAGIYQNLEQHYGLQKLFDGDPDSFWYPQPPDTFGNAALVIEFKNPIQFHRLILKKRSNKPDRYKDICLRIGCL